LGFRRRTAKSAAPPPPPPPFAVLSELEVGQKTFFMAFLCVSQQGEFKNTTIVFGKSTCQKLFAFCQKVEEEKLFSCHFPNSPPSIFF
jgi:hypothetical protein